MSDADNTGTQPIKAVETTFSVVEHLYRNGESTITTMAEDLGIAKSTVYKHLITLQQQGFVVETNHQFALSYRFLTLGGAIRDRSPLCEAARGKLRTLAEETDLMLFFSVMEGTEGVFVYRLNDRIGLGRATPIGVRFYLNQNAAGKAMLAELSDERIVEILQETGLPKQTLSTVVSQNEIFEQVEETRERGYAVNMGERKERLWAVGSAVTDRETGTIGAISIGGPASHISEERLHELGEKVHKVADELELQLMYR